MIRTRAVVLPLLATLLCSCSWVEHSTDPFAGNGSDDGVLAFASDRFGDFEIFVINADGSGLTRITEQTGNDMFPTWSPNADFLVFTGERLAFNRELYRVASNGEDAFNLTQFPGSELQASWSPDGAKIAFSSGRALFIGTEADRGEIAAAELNYLPYAWHTPTYNNQLYVMDSDGANAKKLTDTPFFDEDPSWSPDGKSIAFVSDRDGSEDIFVANADGSNLRTLVQSRGRDISPAWMPQIGFSTRERCLLCPRQGGPNLGF